MKPTTIRTRSQLPHTFENVDIAPVNNKIRRKMDVWQHIIHIDEELQYTAEYLFLFNEEIWKHPSFRLEIRSSAICRSRCYLIIYNIYYLWAFSYKTCNSTHLKLSNAHPMTQFISIIQEISQILNILAACLHLGNIEYTEVDDHTNSVAIREDIYLQHGTSFIYLSQYL